ncbi:T-box protein [Salix suchowensis]|nr:T-box protein [Salix suchowensis]
MGNRSFCSIRFAIFLSISLSASSSSPTILPFNSPSPSSIPKATPSDLLSLLEYNSECYIKQRSLRLHSNSVISVERSKTRLALDSGGDPASIHRALDPTVLPVPDVEGCKVNRCELTRTPYGRRFINEELNSYLEFLFELIVARGPSVGFNVSLNRYDLFHGHIFIARETRRLGILFHAREYPAYDKEVFPYNMGYCQKDSTITYDDSMNLRNILLLLPLPSNSTKAWVAPGVLVVLDAHPDGIIYRDLIPEYVNMARTIYEDDLGEVVVDVNYLNVGDTVPDYKIFIC